MFWGRLALFVGLSAKPIYKDIKGDKPKVKNNIVYRDTL
jgi:hypothetical protein